jgi:hypothetical protein
VTNTADQETNRVRRDDFLVAAMPSAVNSRVSIWGRQGIYLSHDLCASGSLVTEIAITQRHIQCGKGPEIC